MSELSKSKIDIDKLKLINDTNAMKTLFEHYRTVHIPVGFNAINPPTTAHHQVLKEMNRPVIAQWLEEFANEEVGITDNGIGEYSGVLLYSKFQTWKQTNGINYDVSAPQFNMRIHVLRLEGITSKKTKKCNLKVFDFIKVIGALKQI
jgi:hypothetical protein